ncbi:MAG: DNA-binding transcriptional LysR family regulator [Bradymonadia bacterium]|jgi:DNA-binding transcriptional LysR family regulator
MTEIRFGPLTSYWNYLPAFRAVAEHEHFGKGAAALGVTAPAVSRTVSLLEDQLGVKLFTPQGRGVRLSKAGQELLRAVREAMRRIDDGVAHARGEDTLGPFRVSCASSWAAGVVAATVQLSERHPGFVPVIRDPEPDETAGLLRGELDLVVTHDPRPVSGVDVLEISDQTFGVYCGPQHPFFDLEVEAADLRGQRYVVAGGPDDGTSTHWPSDWPRDIAVEVGNLAVRLGLCISRDILAVLPDAAVADHVRLGRLRRLPGPDLRPRTLFALRRERLTDSDLVDEVVEAIASELQVRH